MTKEQITTLIKKSNIKYVGKEQLGAESRYGTDFVNCAINGVSFVKTDFARQSFECAVIKDCTFRGVNFYNTNLENVILEGCTFENCNFEGANLEHLAIENCVFDNNRWCGNTIIYSRIADSTICNKSSTFFKERGDGTVYLLMSIVDSSTIDINIMLGEYTHHCVCSGVSVSYDTDDDTNLIAKAIKLGYTIDTTRFYVNSTLLDSIKGYTININGDVVITGVITTPIDICLEKRASVVITDANIHAESIIVRSRNTDTSMSISSSVIVLDDISATIGHFKMTNSRLKSNTLDINTSCIDINESNIDVSDSGYICPSIIQSQHNLEWWVRNSICRGIDISTYSKGFGMKEFRSFYLYKNNFNRCTIGVPYYSYGGYAEFLDNSIESSKIIFPYVRGPRFTGNKFITSDINDIDTSIVHDTCGTKFYKCKFTGLTKSSEHYIVSTNRRYNGEDIEDEFQKILYDYERKCM